MFKSILAAAALAAGMGLAAPAIAAPAIAAPAVGATTAATLGEAAPGQVELVHRRRDPHTHGSRYIRPGVYGGHRGYRRHRSRPRVNFGVQLNFGPRYDYYPRYRRARPVYRGHGGYSARHHAWCEGRYRSYNRRTGLYVPRIGHHARCNSPYDGI